jgi:hypothetical protein
LEFGRVDLCDERYDRKWDCFLLDLFRVTNTVRSVLAR